MNHDRFSEGVGTKELKVRIPVEYHVRLRSIKLLTGKEMCETIAEALEDYFSIVDAESSSPPSRT